MKDVKNRYRKPISVEEAEVLLHPYVDDLVQIHRAALTYWRDLVKTNPRLGLDDANNQARARIISNYISAEIRVTFANTVGVRLLEDSGFLIMLIDEKAAIRFKKLNDELRPSNIMTGQQSDFATQELLPGFPPEATNLTFGHKLNLTGTEIDGFWLQCPRGTANLWSLSLDKPADLPLFQEHFAPLIEEVTPPVVRAKKRTPSKKMAR
jgi:hypothetical protein